MYTEHEGLPVGALSKIVSSMERDRLSLEELTSDLIKCYPTYIEDGSGIEEAQSIVRRELNALGFIVEEVHVPEEALRSHPLYTRVEAWGPSFSDYSPERHITQSGVLYVGDQMPMLGLNGHVDVEPVFDPAMWRDPNLWRSGAIVGDKIYGRGAADMLGGGAGLLFALKHTLNSSMKPRVNFLFHSVADEEIGGNGTLKCLVKGPRPDWALIAEPTGLTVNQSSLGFHHFRVRSWGTAVHMSQAAEGQSAIDVAVAAHSRLGALRTKLKRIIADGPGFENSVINPLVVGRILGGKDPAVPAEQCDLEGVLFSAPQQTREDVQCLLDEVLSDPPLSAAISLTDMSFDGASSSNRTVPNALHSAGEYFNQTLAEIGFPSPCDMRLYTITGTPTTIFGPGHLTEAHAANESVNRDELFLFSQITMAFLANFCDV